MNKEVEPNDEINHAFLYESKLDSERKKWEFRYNNMKETIKGLEDTVKKQRETIRELKSNKFVIPTGVVPPSKIRGL